MSPTCVITSYSIHYTKLYELSTENEDVRSLREMIIYGLKGMAAYTHHALNISKEDLAISAFIYEALASVITSYSIHYTKLYDVIDTVAYKGELAFVAFLPVEHF